jgi:hypothetical protein
MSIEFINNVLKIGNVAVSEKEYDAIIDFHNLHALDQRKAQNAIELRHQIEENLYYNVKKEVGGYNSYKQDVQNYLEIHPEINLQNLYKDFMAGANNGLSNICKKYEVIKSNTINEMKNEIKNCLVLSKVQLVDEYLEMLLEFPIEPDYYS